MLTEPNAPFGVRPADELWGGTVLFSNVLFPVDFSERSEAIVPEVRALVERFKASLTLLHLVEIPMVSYGTPEAPVMFDFPVDDMKRSAEQKLNRFAASEFAGLGVKTLVGQGDPGFCIPELARMSKVDLIMMPTRGLGKFRAALLGSVTAKILHDAHCPVWTEGHADQNGEKRRQWKTILCAVDTVPDSVRLIRFASDLAGASGAGVRLVHSVPVAEAGAERYFDLEFSAFLEDQARQTLTAMQKEAGTSFPLCVKAGNIANMVREEALSHNADLVLIGRGTSTTLAGRMRSHTYPIVRDMPCAVLSI